MVAWRVMVGVDGPRRPDGAPLLPETLWAPLGPAVQAVEVALAGQVVALTARVGALEAQLGRHLGNSSRPPRGAGQHAPRVTAATARRQHSAHRPYPRPRVMIPPGTDAVRARLGPQVRLQPVEHWIPGRRGLTYLVSRPSDGLRSVFKWCRFEELVCWRDLLPEAPVASPQVYRAWAGTPEAPPAVELEYIPHLATPAPSYRFSPDHLVLTDPAWRGPYLDALFAQLGRMHAASLGGRGPAARAAGVTSITPISPANDLNDWADSMRKLRAVALLPGAAAWIAFWAGRERQYAHLLAELEAFPRTWLWGDAKWDHIGRRADGTVVVLEWSTMLGPAGSDLYLALFEAPARQRALFAHYRRAAGGWLGGRAEAWRYLRLGLARACYVHGPGQACLALRGPAGALAGVHRVGQS